MESEVPEGDGGKNSTILSADLVVSHRPPRNTERSNATSDHKLNNTAMNGIQSMSVGNLDWKHL